MATSLAVLFNRIEEVEIPKQWQLATVKSVRKKGNQGKLSESQRGLFMVNVVSTVYERVKKTQNEKIHKNMNQMQCAGRTQRSTMDNIIMTAIIEKRRTERTDTYLFFADAVKCFDKLWLNDCLIELKTLGYKHNDLRILYEMNKRSIVPINAPFGERGNIEIEETVKQGTTYGPVMCCATTAGVNDIGEKVCCKYGDKEIGMPVFMDDISAVGDTEEIRKGIRNCRKIETLKKFEYGLKKTKIMIVRTGKGEVEQIQERVRQGTVLETDKYKYLGMVINTEGNPKDHIQEMWQKLHKLLEINAIGAKSQVGTEEIRVKLKLFELCLMPTILHGLAAWGKRLTREIEEIERMQSKALKQLQQVPTSISTAGVLMETGIWPAKDYLQYSTMMLYHSKIKSEEERIAKNIVKGQLKYNLQQTFYSRVNSISKEPGVDIKAAEKLRKSAWKKLIKQKTKGSIQKNKIKNN